PASQGRPLPHRDGYGHAPAISPTSTLTPCRRPGQPPARRAASSASAAVITTYPVKTAVAGSPPFSLRTVRTVPTWFPMSVIAAPRPANQAPHCSPSSGRDTRSGWPRKARMYLLMTCSLRQDRRGSPASTPSSIGAAPHRQHIHKTTGPVSRSPLLAIVESITV